MESEQHNPLVSIAILTWNRCEHVVKAIESVFNQHYRPIEVVVTDSASTDGTTAEIRKLFPDVKIIQLHQNLGCPEGRNIALANCSGEFIFSLDDDGWLAPGTLHACVDRFKTDSKIGVVACSILAPDETQKDIGQDEIVSVFSGGASAIRKEVLAKAGYFPSDFFRQAEESDMALRLFANGYSILYCPEAIMYHVRSPINRNSKQFMYYSSRNELFIVLRRYPLFLIPFVLLQKAIVWCYAGLKCGAFFYTVGGVVSALWQAPRLLFTREPVSLDAIRKAYILKGLYKWNTFGLKKRRGCT
jgi:hypothetical protein